MSLALVTGGAGFIGSHLVDALLGAGRRVRVLDDLSTGHLDNLAHHADRIEFVEGTVCDPATCVEAVAGVEVVYHLASRVSVVESVSNPQLYREVVLDGTRNMLDAAADAGARRLVLASSCSVYGEAPPPIGEDAPIDPRSPYAAMKAEAERTCRDAVVSTVCPRFFNVYGARQRADSPYSGVIALFRRFAADGTPPTIFGDGRQTRDFVHVGDVVRGLMLAADTDSLGRGEAVNFGTGVATSILELATLLGCLPPRFDAARDGEVRHSAARVTLARDRLGFCADTTLADGLSRLD